MKGEPKAAGDLRPVFAEFGVEAVIITDTAPAKCELCGVVDELRPYGPNGEYVCFYCGMKDEEACKRAFDARTA